MYFKRYFYQCVSLIVLGRVQRSWPPWWIVFFRSWWVTVLNCTLFFWCQPHRGTSSSHSDRNTSSCLQAVMALAVQMSSVQFSHLWHGSLARDVPPSHGGSGPLHHGLWLFESFDAMLSLLDTDWQPIEQSLLSSCVVYHEDKLNKTNKQKARFFCPEGSTDMGNQHYQCITQVGGWGGGGGLKGVFARVNLPWILNINDRSFVIIDVYFFLMCVM